jgi:hypothetical protein
MLFVGVADVVQRVSASNFLHSLWYRQYLSCSRLLRSRTYIEQGGWRRRGWRVEVNMLSRGWQTKVPKPLLYDRMSPERALAD